jgi:NADH-quinone oxidoreductase subunit L
MLAIPSVVIGYLTVGDMLFGDFFKGIIYVAPEHDVLAAVGANYHGELGFILHGMMAPPFFLAMGGLFVAWFIYMKKPQLADMIKSRLSVVYNILDKKYFFDNFNQLFFAGGSRGIGHVLWSAGDKFLIDGLIVNGSAKAVGWVSGVVRHVQTGYLYHYAFAIIVGMLGLLVWFVTV